MGLDGVELVMEFEDVFGVELKDEEVAKLVTPRMAIDLIFSKLKSSDERTCQTQRAFYIIRNAFVNEFGIKRGDVTLDTRFREFFPKTERDEKVWLQLQSAVKARKWPSLVRPVWMNYLLTGATFAVFGSVVLAAYATIQSPPVMVVVVLLGIILAGAFARLVAKLTTPFKRYIPARLRSIRDLVPYAITSDHVTWNRERVAVLVKKIVIDQLGIAESKYTEGSNFTSDLGIG